MAIATALLHTTTNAQTLTIDAPVFVEGIPFTITGTAAPNEQILVVINNVRVGTTADATGRWQATWSVPLDTGVYTITAASSTGTATADLRVQLRGRLPRQSPFAEKEPRYGEPERPNPDAAQEMTDRWRIAPPPYELDEHSRGPLDPYNKNIYKGDYPWRAPDWFLVLTGISDSLAESRTLPTPSGPSSARPSSFPFFGDDDQGFFAENVIVSGDLFEGNTAFQPVKQRIKATLIANFTHLRVEENGVVKPDVRRGTRRSDSHVALQEIFYERKLRDLSPNYDFLSFRAGSQPFSSDFRGFVYSDTNAGFRLFGNLHSNRWQYNAAIFDRREKDTNSGLNTLYERRNQQVAIANAYFQDFLGRKGYTQQFSVHVMRDDGDVKYDRNGVLVRPAPIGDAQPHVITAAYLGQAGLGHIGRFNLDHAAYFVFGRDSLNPIAGRDPKLRDRDAVRIGAAMAAIEVSYDRDWLRPRVALFYSTGDRNPRDRNARGFDSIFDAPNFAGGGFSFFNRLGIRLAQTGVALVERGSLLPSLRSSKDEGQPNYVNPGLLLASAGLDVDITPRFKAIFTANHIRLDATEPLEEVLFQADIHKHLGEDISLGLKYRPLLSNNAVVVGGIAAFKPGQAFKDIYESGKTLYHGFINVIFQF